MGVIALKNKKRNFIFLILIFCVGFWMFFLRPSIENHTWVLSYAQRTQAPYFVVVHHKDHDFSNDKSMLFNFSEPIELTCEAKNGKLTFTDKTNNKIYEGTYKNSGSSRTQYKVTIEGVQGNANINLGYYKTLFIFIDDYSLAFEVE